jgi:glycosyltransferase involved in cell wall biosynthesis
MNEDWNGEDCSVGNGGFSLRRTRVMLKIVNIFKNDIPSFYNNVVVGPSMKKYIANFNMVSEDVYFAYYLFQKRMGRVPPTRLAQLFSLEMVPTSVPTFGGHCWWLSNTRRNNGHSFIPDICRLVDKIAIIASPFYFTVGGGEKYTSDFMNYLLSNGYHILFFSTSTNYEVFATLRTFLKNIEEVSDRILVIPFSYLFHEPILRGLDADIFYLLSNSGVPEIKGMAKKNILMCQFPFDIEQGRHFYSDWNRHQLVEHVLSYDSFILNSEFSKTHMVKLYQSISALKPFEDEILPKMNIIHPICIHSHSPFIDNYPKKNPKEMVIFVMCARIVENVAFNNNKYIDVAIQTFLKLSPHHNYRLIIMGSVKSFSYYKSLCFMIRGNNKIKIIPNVSSELKEEIMKKSHYILSLTGIKDTTVSSQEHFGITLFEAIQYGCIPISFQGGFAPYYIPNKINGHLIENEEKLFDLLNSILSPSQNDDIDNDDYNKKSKENRENVKTVSETNHLLQSLTMEAFHSSLSKMMNSNNLMK